jgi:hypothetical protein
MMLNCNCSKEYREKQEQEDKEGTDWKSLEGRGSLRKIDKGENHQNNKKRNKKESPIKPVDVLSKVVSDVTG